MRKNHMTDDPILQWVVENLKKPGRSQSELARRLGVHPSAINKLVNGKRGLKSSEIPIAAEYFGEEAPSAEVRLAPAAQLLPITVNGKLAAGVFREVDDFDQSAPERIWEPPDEKFPNARRMAFDVEGDSMNALEPRPIMPGDRLICVAFEDVANQVRVRDGLVVVVERTRDGGHTREWSVKQVELYEDRTEFCPRSTNKAHRPIVVKRDAQADEGVKVEIIALVRSVRNDLPL
jgi:phage repressor protein C with HTH and peptisase S24 domain